MPLVINEREGCIVITVRVIPKASKTELVGVIDGVLKVRIAAPPVDGAANDELVRYLAKLVGVGRSSVSIVSGQSSKTKRIELAGVDAKSLLAATGASQTAE